MTLWFMRRTAGKDNSPGPCRVANRYVGKNGNAAFFRFPRLMLGWLRPQYLVN